MHICGFMTVIGDDNCVRGRSVLLLIFNGFYQGPLHCNRQLWWTKHFKHKGLIIEDSENKQ